MDNGFGREDTRVHDKEEVGREMMRGRAKRKAGKVGRVRRRGYWGEERKKKNG